MTEHVLNEPTATQRLAPEFADVLSHECIIFECGECSTETRIVYHTDGEWDERCATHKQEPVAAALDRARELLSGGAYDTEPRRDQSPTEDPT